MTSASLYINAGLGSCLVIIFIFLDYAHKYNTDSVQRGLFLIVLSGSFIAVVTDFINHILGGIPGKAVYYTLYLVNTLFLIAQNFTFYFLSIFIDYFIYHKTSRIKKIISALAVFLLLYTASVLGSVILGYYFYISENNVYTPARLYPLRLGISYFPILLILADVLAASKHFKRSQIYILIFFGLLVGAGAALDIILKTGSLLWPCFTAALLYFYFFIIQTDSKIDSLTGIGNRYSFNEFINNLNKQNGRQSYAIVLIDMDHFKEINDTFGHLEGDNALRDMAVIIKSCIRHTDFAARYGGDEFILAAKTSTEIEKIMERILGAIQNQNERGDRPYQIQISYGQDIFTTHSGRTIHEFLAHVDRLMYQHKAKRRGHRKHRGLEAQEPSPENAD